MLSAYLTTHEGRRTVSVVGDVDLSSARQLEDALRAAWAVSPHRIVVDLSNVTFCDCAGLHVLLDARALARQAGIAFVITGATARPVSRLIHLAHAERPLRLHTPWAVQLTAHTA
ncbi:STAS domain-containing protein [Streptomyces sp. HMX87]|uniref:STAS domain-containing protein n=1 Tax=Streptomyces sp. HMX87 TaxID=3390849 RepID=UPI003A839491